MKSVTSNKEQRNPLFLIM